MNIIALKNNLIKLLAENLYDNPIITKEFRTRMRGWKPYFSIAIYVIFLSIAMLITYYINWNISQQNPSSLINSELGKTLFSITFIVQTIVFVILLPLSSGNITSEFEDKTIEMVILTKLNSANIVFGKQTSCFLFSIILIACSFPLATLCLIFGGISPLEIVVCYLIQIAWCYFISSIAIFYSSIEKKKTEVKKGFKNGSAFSTYLFCFVYLKHTLILGLANKFNLIGKQTFYNMQPFALLNPGLAPWLALKHVNLYGINVPIALITIILEMSTSIFLLLLATNNIKYKKANRSLSIRLLLIGILFFIIALFCGSNFMSASIVNLKYHLNAFSMTTMSFLVLASSLFATGCIKKKASESIMQYTSKIRNAFKNDLSGGISFMILLTLFCYLFYGVIGVIKSSMSSAFSLSYFLPMYLESGIAIMAIVFCFSSFGIFFSTIVKQRILASIMVFLTTVLFVFIYPALITNSVPGDVNFAGILWPAAPILTATENWTPDMPLFGFPKELVWMVSTVLYSLMGLGALYLANFTHKKYGGVVEEE